MTSAMNVSLRLTQDEEKLKVLRERGALKVPKGGSVETFTLQFDSRAFSFTPNKIITVPQNVAEGLVNQRPLMGGEPTVAKWGGVEHKYLNPLNADWTQVIDVLETWPVGEEAPSFTRNKATMCFACTPARDLGTVGALRAHLAEHEEDLVAVGQAKGAPSTAGTKKAGA